MVEDLWKVSDLQIHTTGPSDIRYFADFSHIFILNLIFEVRNVRKSSIRNQCFRSAYI